MGKKQAEPSNDTAKEFRRMRGDIGVSQHELANILGISAKAVQSYEQGWRHPPDAIRRLLAVVFISNRSGTRKKAIRCWEIKHCPPRIRKECRAYQTRLGHLCWLMRGTKCKGPGVENCPSGFDSCLKCKVCQRLLRTGGR